MVKILAQTNQQIKCFCATDMRPGIQELDLSDNQISDFVGLDDDIVGDLQAMTLDRNPILSFRGFPEKNVLTNVSLVGCPISQIPNFRAIALFVVGPQLKILNGIPITSSDRTAALTYGDRTQDKSHRLFSIIQRGWIPTKPMNYNNEELAAKLEQLVQAQENDPFPLRATRLLKASGHSVDEIRVFIRKYYEPQIKEQTKQKAKQSEDPIEFQVAQQERIISVLAAQLQAIKSGNKVFSDYEEMVNRVAADLVENDKWFEGPSAVAAEEKNVDREEDLYEELRNTVIDFLQLDDADDLSDGFLIDKLNELMDEEEEEEEAFEEEELL